MVLDHSFEVFYVSMNKAAREAYLSENINDLSESEYAFLLHLGQERDRIVAKRKHGLPLNYTPASLDALENQRRAIYRDWGMTFHRLEYVIARANTEELCDEFIAYLNAHGIESLPLSEMRVRKPRVVSEEEHIRRSFAQRKRWADAKMTIELSGAIIRGHQKRRIAAASFLAERHDTNEVCETIVVRANA